MLCRSKTPRKFLSSLYNSMKYRVTNPKTDKHKKLYAGLPIMSKADFLLYENSDKFISLWNQWIASNHKRSLVPTPDRINPMLGYTYANIQWLTLGDNSRRARFEMRNNHKVLPLGVRRSAAKHVEKYEARIRHNYEYVHIGSYDTVEQAEIAYKNFKIKLGR